MKASSPSRESQISMMRQPDGDSPAAWKRLPRSMAACITRSLIAS